MSKPAQQGHHKLIIDYAIPPTVVVPTLERFTEPNLVFLKKKGAHNRPVPKLFVFLPGTGGNPKNVNKFLRWIVKNKNLRVIGLQYNNVPAVVQLCPKDNDPNSSENFRKKRIYGVNATSLVDDLPQESIMNRLVKLLQFLHSNHPQQNWGDYLLDGHPNWKEIMISGISQGAGMAAYIAKHHEVSRAVLFSGPRDCCGNSHHLAPWLSEASATPHSRWFMGYHQKENFADPLGLAARTLNIPSHNVRVFEAELQITPGDKNKDPYHPSTIADGSTPRHQDGTPVYQEYWSFLVGDHSEE